ncbi:MAG: PleD family two-component system response regulator [Gemmatimonadaceae bacterium]
MNQFRTRVLLIDDSPSSLIWQLVLLQEERYDTLTANTTAEGFRIARLERPDLVILDATSRYADVIRTATELRAEPATRDIPILLLVGAGRARASADLAAISDDLIGKPLDGAEYIQKIRELLGRRRRGSSRR